MDKKKEEIQKLMEIAKQPLKKHLEVMKGNYNPAEKFSLMREIQTDTKNYVPTYIIYEAYLNWCADYNQEPINRNQFFKYFSLIFNKMKKGGTIVYLVSSYIFDDITSMEKEVLGKIYSKRISSDAKKNKKVRAKKDKTKETF